MRVIVVDDNELWRSSVVRALTNQGITVVHELADGDPLLALIPELQDEPVDVAVLDLRLSPTRSDEGIALAHKLRAVLPEIGVIILSGYEQDVQLHYASHALSDLPGTGGMGYLFKDRTDRSSLADAVVRVAAGHLVVDTLFAQEAAEEYRDHHAPVNEFTDREIDVLELLVQGYTNKEIATNLYISTAAVERHLTNIFQRVLPNSIDTRSLRVPEPRRENRRVLAVLEWLRRTGRLS